MISISDFKVDPDCVKKNGTVVTQAITNILEKLKSTKLAICRGAIGCGKTTALDYVTRIYKESGWEIEWAEESIDESCINRLLKSNRTLLCCDNYCGSFGCQIFSQEVLTWNDLNIWKILGQNDLKVLIGIHEHVYEEIISNIRSEHFLQETKFYVDLDNLSESELMWIYKSQEEKRTVKQNPISYMALSTITKRTSGLVGIPFQTMMMCALPDTFFNKAFCNEPFQILTEHFKKLSYQNKKKFQSLWYIMCVMIFEEDAKELKKEVAGAISKELDLHTVKYYAEELAPYLKYDGQFELKHELIAIALFHTFLEVFKNPGSICNVYDVRKTLELIRPEHEYHRYHPLAVSLSRESFQSFKTVLKEKIKNENIHIAGHPLMEYFS